MRAFPHHLFSDLLLAFDQALTRDDYHCNVTSMFDRESPDKCAALRDMAKRSDREWGLDMPHFERAGDARD